jgi:hypothetical protein
LNGVCLTRKQCLGGKIDISSHLQSYISAPEEKKNYIKASIIWKSILTINMYIRIIWSIYVEASSAVLALCKICYFLQTYFRKMLLEIVNFQYRMCFHKAGNRKKLNILKLMTEKVKFLVKFLFFVNHFTTFGKVAKNLILLSISYTLHM